MDIKDYSDKELENELKHRHIKRPELLKEPNLDDLVVVVESFVNDLDNTGSVKEDADHYVFEAAMEALYGPDIFEWWGARLEDDS